MARFFRFFFLVELKVDLEITLREDYFHYVVDVLRFKKGDQLNLFNGKGGEFVTQVINLDKKNLRLKVQRYLNKEVESPLKIHLGQIISKKEHMEYTIQKATELGVTTFTPLFGEYSDTKISVERLENRVQRWQKIVIHACEQSGRNRLMVLNPPIELDKHVNLVKNQPLFFLEPNATNKFNSLSELHGGNNINLLIGPEGGFSRPEISFLYQNKAIGLNLGPRILRTETASVVAVAILQNLAGDLK